MKRAITLVLSLFLAVTSQASTNVSGTITTAHWTLAGSPYLVLGDLTVQNSLNIDPGVEVIFQGHYILKVNGTLRADGTGDNWITFKIHDTTNWHNDMIPQGGWRGINFNTFSGSWVDSSLLRYCIIKDVKHGKNGAQNDNMMLSVSSRNLQIDHCNIFHNQSTANQSVGKIISGTTTTGKTITISNTEFHHNKTRYAGMQIWNSGGGHTEVKNSRIHHNEGGCSAQFIFASLLFDNNEVDSNNAYNPGSTAIKIDGGNNTIRGNRIHHNTAEKLAALTCTMGKNLIEKNLICNNEMTDASCGATDGGSGIHISHNNNGIWDSTKYTIRDNIIANNFCNYYGAGIYIYSTKADIYNNHIINNKSTNSGPAIGMFGSNSELLINNNIFFGNESTLRGVRQDISIPSGSFYKFDYNWMEYGHADMVSPTNMTLLGDTIHNIIGTNPNLTNPTTALGLLDNALNKNFRLLATSACINQGSVLGISPSSTDYYGGTRVLGGRIDMGAHETEITTPNALVTFSKSNINIYPNPIELGNIVVIEAPMKGTLSIYSSNGQKVSSQAFDQKMSLKTTPYTSGVYFISISNDKGTSHSAKFVVR